MEDTLTVGTVMSEETNTFQRLLCSPFREGAEAAYTWRRHSQVKDIRVRGIHLKSNHGGDASTLPPELVKFRCPVAEVMGEVAGNSSAPVIKTANQRGPPRARAGRMPFLPPIML